MLSHVRNKVGDAIAEIARQYTDDRRSSWRGMGRITKILYIEEQWPELLGSLFQASQSEQAGQRESAFRIFATTPGIIEKQHEDAVQSAFAKGFKDPEIDVRQFGVLQSQPG